MAHPRRSDFMKGIAEQFAELRTDYDAARQTRFKRKRTGILPTGSGSDYHVRTWHAYASIMETARDLFRNHCLVGQGIRRLVSNILRGGFTLDVSTGDEGLNKELMARWRQWSEDEEQCDRQGEECFHQLERLALQSVIVDGDIVALPTREGSLQLVEGHRMRTPNNTRRNVVHGVLLDDFRRRLQYWITRDDVSPFAGVSRVAAMNQIDARAFDELTQRDERQVFHLYMRDRVSQTRGITALVPVVDTAGMIDDLFFAQLVKAQMAACVTIFRELSSDVTLPSALSSGIEIERETRPDGTIRTIAGWQPGMEIFGYPGESLEGFAPNVPNPEFFQHAVLVLSIVAVNLDIPVAVLMLDPSRTNFSGWRGAMDQARQRFQDIQQWFIEQFHRPVYRWKVRQWAADDPAILKAIQDTVRRAQVGGDGVDAFGHVWHAQEWPYIEPTKDALGDVIQERNLQNSPRRLAAQRGLDFRTLTRERVEDIALRVRLGDEMAKKLNQELQLDPPLTWRDFTQPAMPEGVTVSVGSGPADDQDRDRDEDGGHDTRETAAASLLGHSRFGGNGNNGARHAH